MTSLLIFGGIWFWLLVCTAAIIITACIEVEDPSGLGANITLLISGLLFYFLGNKSSLDGFFSYMAHNPGVILLFILIYLVLGSGWIIFKWWLFLIDARQRIIEEDSQFWASKFEPGNNKSRITHWGIYWPFSAFWTLINNPAKRAFNYIRISLTGTLQKITDSVMKPIAHKARK